MLPPRGVSTAHRIPTKFGRAGNLPNVITHAKYQINWYKIVTLVNGWSFVVNVNENCKHVNVQNVMNESAAVRITWLSNKSKIIYIHLRDLM